MWRLCCWRTIEAAGDHAGSRLRLWAPGRRLRSWCPAVIFADPIAAVASPTLVGKTPLKYADQAVRSSCLPPPMHPQTTPSLRESLACRRSGGVHVQWTAGLGWRMPKKSGSSSVCSGQRFFQGVGAAALFCRWLKLLMSGYGRGGAGGDAPAQGAVPDFSVAAAPFSVPRIPFH